MLKRVLDDASDVRIEQPVDDALAMSLADNQTGAAEVPQVVRQRALLHVQFAPKRADVRRPNPMQSSQDSKSHGVRHAREQVDRSFNGEAVLSVHSPLA
jgi:hypothetical protein